MDWNEYGGIIKVSNSLRKYYGLETYHDTDDDLDTYINEKKPRCIITLLIDAMGVSIINQHLSKDGFFQTNLLKELTTVFPPTTSAATTSLRTGKSPIENGWLGWNQYFEEVDDNLILFFSQSQYSGKQYPGIISKKLPYTDMVEELNHHQIKADSVWPGWSDVHPSSTYKDLLNNTCELSKEKDMHFVYTYWDAFDSLMHHKGPSSIETKAMLNEIEQDTKEFAQKLSSDCLLLVIADHSQIDVRQKNLEQDIELCACFQHEPALEPRTISFSIKEDMKDIFVKRFNASYGKDYRLYTHEEVIKQHIFGEGNAFPQVEDYIGDYVAIAQTNLQLFYKKGEGTKGDHAGGMEEEAIIPLILYTNHEE